MALVVCYYLTCIVRMTMPGIDSRSRTTVFLIRAAFASTGVLAFYIFFWVATHKPIFKDPHVVVDDGEYVAKLLFCLFCAVGEYVARRTLRRMNIFPAKKPIPLMF